MSLPEPVLEHIFQYLSTKNVCNCRLVCRSWYDAARYLVEIKINRQFSWPADQVPKYWTVLRVTFLDVFIMVPFEKKSPFYARPFDLLWHLAPRIRELHLTGCCITQCKLNLLLPRMSKLRSLTLELSQGRSMFPHHCTTCCLLPKSPMLPQLTNLTVILGRTSTLHRGVWPLPLDQMPILRSINIKFSFEVPEVWIRWLEDGGGRLVHQLNINNCFLTDVLLYRLLGSVSNLYHLTLMDIKWNVSGQKPPSNYHPPSCLKSLLVPLPNVQHGLHSACPLLFRLVRDCSNSLQNLEISEPYWNAMVEKKKKLLLELFRKRAKSHPWLWKYDADDTLAFWAFLRNLEIFYGGGLRVPFVKKEGVIQPRGLFTD